MNWKLLAAIGTALFFLTASAAAQSLGIIRGRVNDEQTNEPIPFSNVILQGSTAGTTTDFDGNYELVDVPAGIQNIQVIFVGYEPKTVFEIEVTPARPAVVNVVLNPASIAIEEAEVVVPDLLGRRPDTRIKPVV